jgi:hypothetical protein
MGYEDNIKSDVTLIGCEKGTWMEPVGVMSVVVLRFYILPLLISWSLGFIINHG